MEKKKKEKKRQERFPVVIRLPTSNETNADILHEIKIAITFECRQVQIIFQTKYLPWELLKVQLYILLF